MCIIKTKVKFQDYKICLEADQLENEINHLEKDETDADILKRFIKIIK